MLQIPTVTTHTYEQTSINIQHYLNAESQVMTESEACCVCIASEGGELLSTNESILELDTLIDDLFKTELSSVEFKDYLKHLYDTFSVQIVGLSTSFNDSVLLRLFSHFDAFELNFNVPRSLDSYKYIVYRLLSAVRPFTMPLDQAMEYHFLQEGEIYPLIGEYPLEFNEDNSVNMDSVPDELISQLRENFGVDESQIPDLCSQATEFVELFGEYGTHTLYKSKGIQPSKFDENDPAFVQLCSTLTSIETQNSRLIEDYREEIALYASDEADLAPFCFNTYVHTGTKIEKHLYFELVHIGNANSEDLGIEVSVNSKNHFLRLLELHLKELCQVSKVIDAWNNYCSVKGIYNGLAA